MTMTGIDRRAFPAGVFLCALMFAGSAKASLMFDGVATGKGAGIGTSNIVLTIQNNPTESGCVGWSSGGADVIGSAACPGGLSPAITGGDEKTGNSQTQTRLVSATGVQGGSTLAVILNVGEPAGNLFTVENMSLTIYSPTGTVLFNSGNMFQAGTPPSGGVTINSSFQGQGNLGFAFVLDSTQAAAASVWLCTNPAAIGCAGLANASNANNRIGLAAVLTNVAGSNETFSIADFSSVSVATPEPLTFATAAAGLALLGLFRRFRARRSASPRPAD
jgi:hypothetical protein